MKKQTNRRRYSRLEAKGLFAEINYDAKPLVGNIIDISTNGLAFFCFDYEELATDSNKPHKINIFHFSGEILLSDVPCKNIEDGYELSEHSFSNIPVRKCSFQFNEMTQGQIFQLSEIISKYT